MREISLFYVEWLDASGEVTDSEGGFTSLDDAKECRAALMAAPFYRIVEEVYEMTSEPVSSLAVEEVAP